MREVEKDGIRNRLRKSLRSRQCPFSDHTGDPRNPTTTVSGLELTPRLFPAWSDSDSTCRKQVDAPQQSSLTAG
eukprot:2044147-Rhodomonas_salina.1